MRVGNLELFPISDGTIRMDGGGMFGIVPKVVWEKRKEADPLNRVTLALRCLLIRAGTTHILVDTGVGDKEPELMEKRFAASRGEGLIGELARLSLGPEDIDVVVNTHLHFDHAGGNTRRDGERIVPTFPRARYVVQQGHWDEAMLAERRGHRSYPMDNILPLREAGVLELVTGEQELAPGVRLHLTPGHCHHHQSVVCSGGGAHAIFLGDLLPTAAHAPLTWVMAYDVDPAQTVETRRRLYAEFLKDDWRILLDHETAFACGRLEESGGRYRVVATG